MKVGYLSDNYPYTRNVIDILPDADYAKVHDVNKWRRKLQSLANKILRSQVFDNTDLAYSFNDFNLNRVDLIHTFNSVCFNRTPWITTFETIVPRFKRTVSRHSDRSCSYTMLARDPQVIKALEALAGDACKQIIALSDCNLRMQVDLLQHFPEYQSAIERKLVRLHPPQPLLVDESGSEKPASDGTVRFMFVGGSFFRKGGMEILETFQEAKRNKGYDLELYIVSSLAIDNYATGETEQDVVKAQQLIEANSDWVRYWKRLENQRVIDLMRQSHVGLLPTYADTYGYSVLEFQAAGCPVITTNVRALPEINNNDVGWVIEVPKNRLGEAIYATEEDRAAISRNIRAGLMKVIDEVMENRQVIDRKSSSSIKHIRENHSPREYAMDLRKIYCSALG